MIVLGIDTSLRSTGYGVLEVLGSRMKMIECGNIKNAPKIPLTACLKAIHDKVAALIEAYIFINTILKKHIIEILVHFFTSRTAI